MNGVSWSALVQLLPELVSAGEENEWIALALQHEPDTAVRTLEIEVARLAPEEGDAQASRHRVPKVRCGTIDS